MYPVITIPRISICRCTNYYIAISLRYCFWFKLRLRLSFPVSTQLCHLAIYLPHVKNANNNQGSISPTLWSMQHLIVFDANDMRLGFTHRIFLTLQVNRTSCYMPNLKAPHSKFTPGVNFFNMLMYTFFTCKFSGTQLLFQ